MNKLLIYISFIGLIGVLSCSDELDVEPTDKSSKETIFATVENSYVALNGIYRNFYTENDWSTGYGTESFGLPAINIALDLMGEDFLMNEKGSAWFWYDYKYWVRGEINNTSDRPFVWWNEFYKYINNANNIIANIDGAQGSSADRNDVKGQSFGIRAFSYLNLIQMYQRTYIGHENDPGVPLYVEPTSKTTEGKGRGTVEEVYEQINLDVDSAIFYLEKAGPARHKSHISLAVANGLKARVALIQNKWSDAASYAQASIDAHIATIDETSDHRMSTEEIIAGFNAISSNGWMWGSQVNNEQATSWASFYSHMDADIEGYAKNARKCIASWVYDQIQENDIRKQWFNGALAEDAVSGSELSYNQFKFRVPGKGSYAGDNVYMRAAEMYLIIAEANCRLGQYAPARNALNDLIGYKNPDYADYLATVPDGMILTLQSAGPINTLLDEIILQRRIELWGEGFRVYDIMRLKTGFDRGAAGDNHPDKLAISDPESWEWIMMIPQKEFDGNPNMDDVSDQNP